MKVYLVIEYGGEYEDYSERIRKGYLSREKAEEKIKKLEFIEIERRKCGKCPLYYCPDECNHKCGDECSAKNMTDEEMRAYCKAYEPFDPAIHSEEEYDTTDGCVNFEHPWDDLYYRIDELEIEE